MPDASPARTRKRGLIASIGLPGVDVTDDWRPAGCRLRGESAGYIALRLGQLVIGFVFDPTVAELHHASAAGARATDRFQIRGGVGYSDLITT